jgi:hypothetical protein
MHSYGASGMENEPLYPLHKIRDRSGEAEAKRKKKKRSNPCHN